LISLVTQIISALVAYLKYRFDPKMIERRDKIHKQLAEDYAHDEVLRAISGNDTLSLSYFVSEFLRRHRVREEATDRDTRREADLLIGVLPKPRSTEDRHKDLTEGF
jgi:hypothetical protein